MATSAVAIALMTATPALADSNKGSGNDDRGISVNFGGIVRDLAKNFDREGTSTNFGKVVRDLAHERNDDKDRKHATTTVSISGVVTGINGTTITLSGRNGAVFTVNGANATVTGDEHTALTLGSIKLGDTLKVSGTLSGGVILATKIVDKSTVDSSVTVSGTVAALSGSTLTVTGENGATYTVNAASSTINGSSDISMLGKIQVGDRITIKGSLNGSVITAKKITDNSLKQREFLATLSGVRAGVVTAISGSNVTLDRFGTGTTSVTTTGSTFFTAGGSATTSSALTVGSNILVFGPTTTGAVDSITATVLLILNHSIEFLRNLFR